MVRPSRLRKDGDRHSTPSPALAKQPVAERRASPCARVSSRPKPSCRGRRGYFWGWAEQSSAHPPDLLPRAKPPVA